MTAHLFQQGDTAVNIHQYRGYLKRFISRHAVHLMIVVTVAGAAVPAQCTELFRVRSLALADRTLAVLSADLDDSGPSELVVIKKTGIYPGERRWIAVFEADADLNYGPEPRQQWEVDPDATLFEVGDVAASPGKEIFFLTPKGIFYYARQKNGLYSTTSHVLISRPTATVFPAAGGLPRMTLLSDWQGDGRKMLLLPQFDAFVLFRQAPGGNWLPAEKMSMVPRTFLYSGHDDDGILKSFSLRMDYRLPNIFSQDFNGDGTADLILTEQETIFVYPSLSGGRISQTPAVAVTLPGRSDGEEEWDSYFHAIPSDLNNDGFTDIILTFGQGAGGFLERKAEVLVFLNQQTLNQPFSDHPDQVITFYGISPGICIRDINHDGLKDLLFSNIELGFWNTVKNLISKQVDVYTSVHLFQKEQRFSDAPDFFNKTKYHLELTQGIHFKGIWPSLEGDFNADGYPDLLIATDGKVTIYQTLQEKPLLSSKNHQADVPTYPFRLIADINHDGLDDLIMYEKKKDAQLSVLVNTGSWLEDTPNQDQSRVNGR